MEQPSAPSRRVVITLSSSAAAAAALAACAPSGGGTTAGGSASGGSSAGDTSAPGSAGASSAAGAAGSSGARGPELAKAADVPVGSSRLVGSGNAQVLLSHPAADTFRAFSPSCTHQGCTVEVRSDTFHCPCHGSEFALADGAVLTGPAERPLIERRVTVADGTVYLA